jgi:uncharacterized membrane protein
MRTTRLLGIALIAIGAVLFVVGLLAPSGHFGMGTGTTTYSTTNIALMAGGVAMIAVGIVLVLLKEERAPRVKPGLPAFNSTAESTATPAPGESSKEEREAAEENRPTDEASRNELVLRLLTGDERIVFKIIADSGGVALQKDLIVKSKMSDAKVSRTIDKLVGKGLVKKERYGVTNRITITSAEKPPE